MSEEDLLTIHARMLSKVEQHGGRIDKIYYCTAIDSSDPCRKPNHGMAIQAKKDFPDIDFSKSIMVGDSDSDRGFAEKAGLKMVCVNEEIGLKNLFHPKKSPEASGKYL